MIVSSNPTSRSNTPSPRDRSHPPEVAKEQGPISFISGPGTVLPTLPKGTTTSETTNPKISQKYIQELHSKGMLGPQTTCVLFAHGNVDEDGHHVFLASEASVGPNKMLPTVQALRWIRNLPNEGAEHTGSVYEGPIWIFSCQDKAVLDELQHDTELLEHGYVIVSGSEHPLDRTVAEQNIVALGKYMTHCQENKTTPHHLDAFMHVVLEGSETAAIIGGDFKEPVIFEAPSTLDELNRNARHEQLSQKLPNTTVQPSKTPSSVAVEQAFLIMARRSSATELIALAQSHPELVKNLGFAALTAACEGGQWQTVRWLIGQDILEKVSAGRINTMLVAMCKSDPRANKADAGELLKIADELIARYRELLLGENNPDHPLVYAFGLNHRVLIEHFLEKGAPINVTNGKGRTPLMVVCARGHQDDLELLIKRDTGGKLLIDQVDKGGVTALMHSVAHDKPEMVERLMELKANVNLKSFNDHTALSVACRAGNLAMVQLLLQSNAEVPEEPDECFSQLAKKGRPGSEQDRIEIAKLLIDRGAKPDSDHVEKAQKSNHMELAELLEANASS